MTLNASGPISIGGTTQGQSIELELAQSGTATASLNDSAFRTLAVKASGAIALGDFYSKSAGGGGSSTDPYFSNTVLLLHMDGSNAGTTFTDSSIYGRSITVTNASTSTAQFKYGATSGSFNGSNTYLSTPATSDLNTLSVGDFTVECWVRPTATGAYRWLWSQRTNSSNSFEAFMFDNGTAYNLQVVSQVGAVAAFNMYPGTYDIPLNVWTHIAVTKAGSTVMYFVNGTMKASQAVTGTLFTGSTNFVVGARGDDLAYPMLGYIDDFRATKGIARYTNNFTVPAAAYPDAGPASLGDYPNYPYVILLAHMNGSNGGTTFTDSGPATRTITVTSAVTSTTQIKFGTASGYFNGSSQLDFPSAAYDFSADWTIECWVYYTSAGYICSKRVDPGVTGPVALAISVNKLQLLCSQTGSSYEVNLAGAITISSSTWTYVAATRHGDVYTTWVNGVQDQTATVSGGLITNSATHTIGASANNNNQPITGYLDDFRMTSRCRYIANFSVPTAALLDLSNYATWNPSDKGASQTLSGGNLTVTTSATNGTTRATMSKASGKWYWEYQSNTHGTAYYGEANASATLTNCPGQDANAWGYRETNGKIYNNNAAVASGGGTIAANDYVGLGLDLDNGVMYVYKNNVLQLTATVSGTLYPAFGNNSTVCAATANFGQNALTYTPPNGTFWNPADKSAYITLINNNLSKTQSVFIGAVRSNTSKSTGKWYFEIRLDAAASSFFVGVANSSASTGAQMGSDANGWSYDYGGKKYNGGSLTDYGSSYVAFGDVIGVAVDMTNGKLYFSKNGTWQNSGDPVAGTGYAFNNLTGTLFAGFGAGGGGTSNGTANFGATPFAYSPPANYLPWDTTVYNPGVY